MNRRGFITGLISFAATAPAIVKAGSLMPVKLIDWDAGFEFSGFSSVFPYSELSSGELIKITRAAFLPRLAVQIYKPCPLEANRARILN